MTVEPFPQFGVVSDFSDHHYAKSRTKISAAVSEKIMEEWKDLENHLPDSIFVRAYQDRMDLLRAVIIGAKGTPYHDGLYFLDISFPSDYPARPPRLHYRSFGWEINPNLHADGKVCLRLANTWPGGNATEEWNPKSSTVRQVLLSIQALVLNDKPYFNRPGREIYTGWSNWGYRSNGYNERVFLLSCKTMSCLMRKPPKNFEAFVVSHFKERAAVILAACDAYVNESASIGHYCTDGAAAAAAAAVSYVHFSRDFKWLMEEPYANLVSSLNGLEAKSMSLEAETMSLEAKTKKIGISRRVWEKLKKVLGLKSRKENVEKSDQMVE